MSRSAHEHGRKYLPNRIAGAGLGIWLSGTLLLFPEPTSAQTFSGTQTTNGPFSGGTQIFEDSSTLNASSDNAVSGGDQFFTDTSALNASAANAVTGGNQAFALDSALNASVGSAVSGGTQTFFDDTALNASAANAVIGGGQSFGDRAALNALAADAVSGGEQLFEVDSALNASVRGAVSGGLQTFGDSSTLNAASDGAVIGGEQFFAVNSTLDASAGNAVIGGSQIFSDTSALNVLAGGALGGGTQTFMENSALDVSAAGGVTGGTQSFSDASTLNARAAGAISGGTQLFAVDSALNASVGNAVIGGTQSFSDTSKLDVLAAGALGSGTQTFSGNSALDVSAAGGVTGGTQSFSGTSTLNALTAGAVSGGRITVSGNGTVQVRASNALSNGASVTFEDTGRLVLNGNGTAIGRISSGDGAGIVENGGAGNATLTVDSSRSGDSGFGGVLRDGGTGALELAKTGTGTLMLSGANSYTGGTMLLGGVLQVSADANLGAASGALTFDGGGLSTTAGFESTRDLILTGTGRFDVAAGTAVGFSGAVSGGGDLVKLGDGTLQLAGDGSGFVGTTTISDGLLSVGTDDTTRLGGVIALLSGGALGGSGQVGTTRVAAGATVSPGNSIGTLTVEGDITFAPGSVYAVETVRDGTASDTIRVTGTATLDGGTVAHTGMDGRYTVQSYPVLTADSGVVGRFDGVSSDYAFLAPRLSYAPTAVFLELRRNDVDFADRASTRNQKAAARAAQGLGAGNPLYDTVLVLSDDGNTVRAAFDAVSGEIHGSAMTALINGSHAVREIANGRLRTVSGENARRFAPILSYRPGGPRFAAAGAGADRSAVWSTAFGTWSDMKDGGGNAARLDYGTGGILAGADALFAGTWRLGLLAGHSRTGFDVDERGSSGSSDNYHLGAYGGTEQGALGVRAGLAFSWHDVETVRPVAFGQFRDRVDGGYDARTIQAFGEFGYRIDTATFSLEPFAGLAYVGLRADGYAEAGGAAALAGKGRKTDTAFGTLGVRASTVFALGGREATVHGTAGWRHAFADTRPLASHAFAGGDAFTIAGVPVAVNTVLVGAGLDLRLSGAASLGLSYSGEFATEGGSHGVNSKLTMRF